MEIESLINNQTRQQQRFGKSCNKAFYPGHCSRVEVQHLIQLMKSLQKFDGSCRELLFL
jgi:hypothetical protein